MEWTSDASLALIEHYRKQPVLWNTRHSYYYSKTRKQKAWEKIAFNMDIGTEEARQKMNSLLGSFRREKSKMRRGEGRYALGNCTSSWFAFDKLLFLLDRHKEISEDKVYLEELQMNLEEEEEDLALDSDSNHLLEEELNEASLGTCSKAMKPPPTKKAKFTHQSTDLSIEEQECIMYGQYLTKKLMRMSSRTRAFVQNSINNIVFEADLGKYEDLQET